MLFIVVKIIETYDCLKVSLVTNFMLYCEIGIKLLNLELFKGRECEAIFQVYIPRTIFKNDVKKYIDFRVIIIILCMHSKVYKFVS